MAAVTQISTPRPALSTTGIQLVTRGRVTWAKKAAWLRNPPYTVGPLAHDGQIEVRLAFAEAARQARGMKGLDPETGLPHAAAHVMRKLSGYMAPHRMDPARYPSKIRRTAYTASELESIARQRGLTVPRGFPTARPPPG